MQTAAGAEPEAADPEAVEVALDREPDADAEPAQPAGAGQRQPEGDAVHVAAAAFFRDPDGGVEAVHREGRDVAEVEADAVDVLRVADADPDVVDGEVEAPGIVLGGSLRRLFGARGGDRAEQGGRHGHESHGITTRSARHLFQAAPHESRVLGAGRVRVRVSVWG